MSRRAATARSLFGLVAAQAELVRADVADRVAVDVAVLRPIDATLVRRRRRARVREDRVDRRAARQQSVRRGEAAVQRERTKHWIDTVAIVRPRERAAEIAAGVVAQREGRPSERRAGR